MMHAQYWEQTITGKHIVTVFHSWGDVAFDKEFKAKWMPVPDKDFGHWVGQWMISNVMMDSFAKHGKFPKRIKFVEVKELASGEAYRIINVEY